MNDCAKWVAYFLMHFSNDIVVKPLEDFTSIGDMLWRLVIMLFAIRKSISMRSSLFYREGLE